MDKNQLETEFNKMLDQLCEQVISRQKSGELSEEDANTLIGMISDSFKPAVIHDNMDLIGDEFAPWSDSEWSSSERCW